MTGRNDHTAMAIYKLRKQALYCFVTQDSDLIAHAIFRKVDAQPV